MLLMKWRLTRCSDDTITVGAILASATTTLAGDIIAGGDGTDTISVTSAVGNAQTAYGNVRFEELSISDIAEFDHGGKLSGWFDNG